MASGAAADRTRERLEAPIDGRLASAPERSDLVRLAARLILEEALEGEVRDRLGRERHERADGEPAGERNGCRTGRMTTAEGRVEHAAPQGRDPAEPFVSAVRENLAGRTGALEDLAIELHARGLPTRDIEDTFTDPRGRRRLSRAAVSEITERLWDDQAAFPKRGLAEHRVVCLHLDGIAERLRAGQPREAVLAAWGIGADGRKVLLHRMAGSKEDTETVRAFFPDMRGRGRGDPLLVVSDGAPGVLRAIEEGFPRPARQRCRAHRMRNPAVKVPTDRWPELKARVTACYQAPPRAIARDLAIGIRAAYARTLPSAVACLEDDLEACIAHLRLPVTHRRAARTTNPLERLFVEDDPQRGSSAAEDHPQRLRREGGAQADARGADPGGRSLARPALQRVRAPADRGRAPGARRRIRGDHHPFRQTISAARFQQDCALTLQRGGQLQAIPMNYTSGPSC
jgi:transposase-like protein